MSEKAPETGPHATEKIFKQTRRLAAWLLKFV